MFPAITTEQQLAHPTTPNSPVCNGFKYYSATIASMSYKKFYLTFTYLTVELHFSVALISTLFQVQFIHKNSLQ
jgi:hypothetical protein